MLIVGDIRDRVKCDNAEKLTFEELYKLIMEAIELYMPDLVSKDGDSLEIMPILDYGMASYLDRKKKLSEIEGIDTAHIRPVVYPGGSEGTLLDVSLLIPQYGKEDVTISAFFFKTLREDPMAYASMGALGGMISYALEMFFWVNF